ncbi:hypothetical protein Forpe1208_v005577 [Fusarium oxysporum f. sp. rapae]|uniref:Uncharacterized protein n=1 Tax=Fusarium oxysporum f. sp. rapae TaxID=485398 RepID=A0A8J5P1H5_FUSOX|nr:hypothetical protein Forpe1208_v005577 [Fusarium oxysporum f. sp. rapae]
MLRRPNHQPLVGTRRDYLDHPRLVPSPKWRDSPATFVGKLLKTWILFAFTLSRLMWLQVHFIAAGNAAIRLSRTAGL